MSVNDPVSIVQNKGAIGTWSLDGSSSQVEFAAKTFWGLLTVKGRFTDVDGQVQVDGPGSVNARLVIEVASLDTKQTKRDEHLRSSDFFDAEHHPRMEIAVDEIELTGLDRAAAQGRMTVAGQTHPISFDATVTLAPDGQRVELDASIEVDRTDFGMTWSPMGMVRRAVRGSAHLVLNHAEPSAK